jgi:DNA adenine methylase
MKAPIQNTLFNDSTSAIFGVKTTHKEPPLLKSPLRYPGGKSRAVKEILQYFPIGLDTIASPFLGGGSIELALASKGVEVYAYDVFEPLTDFWQVLLKEPKKLAELVRQYHPLTNSKFYSLQKEFLHLKSKREKAAVFFVLNRASFSGTTLSGGMSPHHPRFTEKIIEYIESFKTEKLHVEKMDFHQSIAKHKNDFLYLDPPYANGEGLYGTNGDTHKAFDHTGLATVLKSREGWVLSYNDCEKVRDWYKGFTMLTPKWAYGMNTDKKSSELLILSKDYITV